ncbi:Lethal(2) giant larvae sro7 [Coemansia sp. BCRC 34301]|nr:Lethal(2) giant larvae sro7 [Coemansia sp. BCRC 34301]
MEAKASAAPTLEVVEDRLVDPKSGATAVGFDPTQGVLAVGYDSGCIDLYSPRHPTCARLRIGLPGAVAHVKFVPGQPSLAAIDGHGVLRVFDTDTLQLCFSYNVPSLPTCLSLLPGTRWLMVGTEAGRVYFVNSGEGLKSDFSIGSRVQPPSRVVTVESHPIKTEKVLIAYAEGTCVVCDLGKGSLSEREMVLSKHRYEHPEALMQSRRVDPIDDSQLGTTHYAGLLGPQLTGAGWSPSGDQLASTYTNGVFCIFGTGSGPGPIVARTIGFGDALSVRAADLERNMQCLKSVRWCTLAGSDQSFLIVTSGAAASYQQIIHVFGTDSQVKSGSDIVPCEHYSLDTPISCLTTIPSLSPWRNECEGVSGLAFLAGKPAVVKMLELGPRLHLISATERLPGDLTWSAVPATLIRVAHGDLAPALRTLLAPAPMPDRSATDHGPNDLQLFSNIDRKGTLSLWYIAKGRLVPCTSVELDARYTSWILGIEGTVVTMDVCARSGLMVLGMDSGEALVCILHNGAHPLPLAPRSMSSGDIRDQAAKYYFVDDQATNEASGPKACPVSSGVGPESSVAQGELPPSAVPNDLVALQRNRAASVSGSGFIRRSSKRLSTSIGTLLRRGARARSTGGSYATSSSGHTGGYEDSLEAGMASLRMSATNCSPGSELTRPMPIDLEAWKTQQTVVNEELSGMLYGLRLDAAEQTRAGGLGPHPKPVSRPRVDSGAPIFADSGHAQPLQPGILPLMLARFFRRKVTSATSSQDGIIALVYEGGVLVVIDSLRQRVLLVDNINQAPSAAHTARDVFFGSRNSSSQAAEWSAKDAEITAVSIVRLGRDIALRSLGDATEPTNSANLFIGTSHGCVMAYAIGDMVTPPVVVERSRASAILSLGAYHCQPGHFDSEAAGSDCAQALVVGSQKTVTVHSAKTLEPITSYALPARASVFVAVRAIELASGWRGVLAIDSQANATLLALPQLKRVLVAPIPEARALIASAEVQISDHGLIFLLGPGGVLLQAEVTDPSSQHGVSTPGQRSQQTMFDASVVVPPLPVRKGITSWLLGKTSNASQDIDAFLGSHCRDLLAKGGGIKPGMRLQEALAPNPSDPTGPTDTAPKPDRAVDDVSRSVDLGGVAESKNMLDKRGQQLEQISERMQEANMQAKGFLDDIRAYNAKKESSSKKRFGLF